MSERARVYVERKQAFVEQLIAALNEPERSELRRVLVTDAWINSAVDLSLRLDDPDDALPTFAAWCALSQARWVTRANSLELRVRDLSTLLEARQGGGPVANPNAGKKPRS